MDLWKNFADQTFKQTFSDKEKPRGGDSAWEWLEWCLKTSADPRLKKRFIVRETAVVLFILRRDWFKFTRNIQTNLTAFTGTESADVKKNFLPKHCQVCWDIASDGPVQHNTAENCLILLPSSSAFYLSGLMPASPPVTIKRSKYTEDLKDHHKKTLSHVGY